MKIPKACMVNRIRFLFDLWQTLYLCVALQFDFSFSTLRKGCLGEVTLHGRIFSIFFGTLQ